LHWTYGGHRHANADILSLKMVIRGFTATFIVSVDNQKQKRRRGVFFNG
jgi:hypothetical protein